MTPPWLEKAQEHLEWHRLESALLSRCRGEGARRAGLPLADTRQESATALAETRETLALLRAGERLPLDDLRDVAPHFPRLQRSGVLEASALSDVRQTLRNARAMRDFLAARREEAPHLARAFFADPALDGLESQLDDALEADGTLSDDASPELRSLRTEISNLRERIIGRLESLIDRYQDVLSDRLYTLREGRYVLPVRRDAHERVHGIVHGTSQSGASVFVEPRPVVAHGNRLKMAQSELEREERRILSALSELVRERLPSLEGAVQALDRMDLRAASARLGVDTGAEVPELAEECGLSLVAARHPLLVLDGLQVVPNDVSLQAGRGLVISGPNAGGKTVLLKLLGLYALMVRAGLPVPAAEGSRVGFFERVLTDVGDEQSTVKNLSTFSAHITNLAAILEHADTQSLVLLDEVATGTDPEEGAALACALVDALCEAGAALAVTTHYEALKALSLGDPRLRSASVGFDVERMDPSFRLALDVPGASSALSVARRFGIPEAVIARAQEILPEQAQAFDRLVRELAERVEAARQRELELQQEARRAEELTRKQRDRLEKLKRDGDARVAGEVQGLVDEVKRLRGHLDRARASLRDDKRDARAVAEADKLVAQVAQRVALGGDLASKEAGDERRNDRGERERIPVEAIKPGVKAHVARLRSEATVVEGPSKGRARVAVGPLKLWVDVSELLAPRPEREGEHRTAKAPGERSQKAERTPDNTISVKGMRVDDALSMVESFLDRLYTTDHRVGYVVHGHGSGALRDAIRGELVGRVPHVTHAHAAIDEEGGDAVTVLHLAD
ncbi:MAG: Smr/MutS family protein [Myxococcales bacterium]|jgi:DNA mismatch repair protein MutS2